MFRALDLFCGAGGATHGMQQAGFHVTGVDIRPQPRYCGDSFVRWDALEYGDVAGCFDFIWASPPCQAHTSLNGMHNAKEHADLIPQTRWLLKESGRPYVIENVEGAPLRNPFTLCGTMFGLGTECGVELHRHRIFEANFRRDAARLQPHGRTRHRRLWRPLPESQAQGRSQSRGQGLYCDRRAACDANRLDDRQRTISGNPPSLLKMDSRTVAGAAMTSPFSRVGAKLVDQQYSVIPVLPQSKRPGSFSQGRWWGDLDWNRFCARRPTDIELGIWNTWPDAGVCVALGPASGNLIALDIDTDDGKIIAAIESVIEPSPVQKMGKKGRTLFYRSSGNVASCAFNVLGGRVLDLLSNGKQSLLPPTVHPDTGQPYVWLTMATLEDTTVDRLPMLPDDIAARLGVALAPFGYTSPVTRPPIDGDGGIWREVNDAALRRLDDWVPALGIDAKRGHDGRWRGRAIWKQAEHANVGFSAQGIKDWGADSGHTALDVVMLAHGVDFPTAEKWLRERLGFKELAPVRFTFRKAPAEPVFVEVPKPTITANLPKVDPWDHKVAGGLLEQTARWIYDSSFVPSRELSLLASIGVMAAFMGRRYVGPTGLGTSLYLIGLGSTGSGKDGPLSGIQNLLDGGMRHWLGSGDIASDSVLEKRLRTRPSCVYALDEIGALLQENSRKGAAAHHAGRRKTLLELYSKAKVGGVWSGKDRAGDEVLSSDCPLYMPCMSIFGVSTPEEFFKGITQQNLRDGLLNRLTVIHVPPCERRDKFLPQADVPRSLLNSFDRALEIWRPDGKPLPRSYINATMKPIIQRVEFADQEASDRADKVWEWQQDYIVNQPGSDGYIRRGYEQALKIAMIRAVSRDFSSPSVMVEDVDFADAIVSKSVEMLSNGMKDYRSDSEFEENWKLLLRHVDETPKGLTDSQLTHRAGVGKIEPRRLKDATEYLTRTGRWEHRKTGKRGGRYFSTGGRVMKEDDDG